MAAEERHPLHPSQLNSKPPPEVSLIVKAYIKNAYLFYNGATEMHTGCPRVSVSVRMARFVKKFAGGYHVFVLEVDTDYGAWTCCRRYSQFAELHDQMSRVVERCKAPPPFPPRRVNFLVNSDELAHNRIRELNAYIQFLTSTPAMYNPYMWAFLGVQPFSSHFVPDHNIKGPVTPARVAFEFVQNSSRTASARLIEYAAALLRSVTSAEGEGSLPSLREMFVQLIHTGHISFIEFGLALFYARRIQHMRGEHSIKCAPHLLLMALLIITAKFWFDVPAYPLVNNWFSSREICAMELECLAALGFDLNIELGEYEQFVMRLERAVAREFADESAQQKAIEGRQHRSWTNLPALLDRQDSARLSTWIFIAEQDSRTSSNTPLAVSPTPHLDSAFTS